MQKEYRTKNQNKFVKFRKIVLISTIALVFPICLGIYTLLGGRAYALMSMLFVILAILPFLMIYEMKKPQAREWIPLAVMAALAAVGRVAFAPVPFFKPTSAIIIITASVFGPEAGFLTGTMAALASNLFFGQGPWTPWQMFSFGIIGFLAGIMFQKGILRKTKTDMCLFGFVATFVIYGGIMNPASVIMWQSNININMVLSSYVMGMPFDFIHAVSTVFFLFLAAEPMLEKLERIKIKYGLIE